MPPLYCGCIVSAGGDLFYGISFWLFDFLAPRLSHLAKIAEDSSQKETANGNLLAETPFVVVGLHVFLAQASYLLWMEIKKVASPHQLNEQSSFSKAHLLATQFFLVAIMPKSEVSLEDEDVEVVEPLKKTSNTNSKEDDDIEVDNDSIADDSEDKAKWPPASVNLQDLRNNNGTAAGLLRPGLFGVTPPHPSLLGFPPRFGPPGLTGQHPPPPHPLAAGGFHPWLYRGLAAPPGLGGPGLGLPSGGQTPPGYPLGRGHELMRRLCAMNPAFASSIIEDYIRPQVSNTTKKPLRPLKSPGCLFRFGMVMSSWRWNVGLTLP